MPRKSVPEKPLVVSSGGAAAAPARHKSSTPKRAARTAGSTTVTFAEPTQEEIARLAYSYWEARGCQGGSAEEDWIRAAHELRASRK